MGSEMCIRDRPSHLLLSAVSHSDPAVLVAALELLCVSPRAAQPCSRSELALALAGFSCGLTGASPAFRHRTLSCWKALLSRTRDACVPHLEGLTARVREVKGEAEAVLLLPDLRIDWRRLEAEVGAEVEFRTAVTCDEQLENLSELLWNQRRLLM